MLIFLFIRSLHFTKNIVDFKSTCLEFDSFLTKLYNIYSSIDEQKPKYYETYIELANHDQNIPKHIKKAFLGCKQYYYRLHHTVFKKYLSENYDQSLILFSAYKIKKIQQNKNIENLLIKLCTCEEENWNENLKKEIEEIYTILNDYEIDLINLTKDYEIRKIGFKIYIDYLRTSKTYENNDIFNRESNHGKICLISSTNLLDIINEVDSMILRNRLIIMGLKFFYYINNRNYEAACVFMKDRSKEYFNYN